MIGLDTNVLVRYIMQDDPKNSPKANQLIESLDADNPGYITMVSVIELYWVLTSCYELTGEQVGQALGAMLRTKSFLVERADQVMRALRVFADGRADFADCLIERSASGAGCTQTMTFDVGASKHAGMTLIA
ncbi:type II toxin-antitoxin system VapC family toxin [Rhodoferax sp.]|uniref:PIN domain-containing protein n=1 Tax=Rhodoferax sp. TaxID=50421 RepID=UPI00260E97A6|nr:type II toxin-antitoxin system VapC family toxin [Rhodoferax sp.]MDD2809894.1 type II toxin-antitoxin system VapC family toxin [Rhodoferax sp.]